MAFRVMLKPGAAKSRSIPKGGGIMARFDGYLFSKLALIGTKSEGPSYFLQQWDYREIPVVKRSFPWKPDPELHRFLDRKVTIWGGNGPGRYPLLQDHRLG
jgi:hypothetical protein